MSQDNFNVLQPEALSDECLIAKKNKWSLQTTRLFKTY